MHILDGGDMFDVKIDLGGLFTRFAEKFGRTVFGAASAVATTLADAIRLNFSEYYETTIYRCANIKTLISRDVPVPIDQIYVCQVPHNRLS